MTAKEDSNQRGGILADEMGLGKTIQALSLIASRPSIAPRRRATLVVVPAGLISQWKQEIVRLLPPAPYSRVFVLHGNSGAVNFSTVNEYEIVLTSFGTVEAELRRKQGRQRRRVVSFTATNEPCNLPILGPSSTWHRVILDEAQGIKNDKSCTALACCEIDATYRWCLTGTPVMNNLRELYSLFKFLRIESFSALNAFHTGREVQVQAVLKNILLRRTTSTIINGQPILQLPPLEIENVYLSFNDTEQRLYTAVNEQFQDQCSQYRSIKGGQPSVTHMLTLLRRLQQACCHPFLIPDLEDVISKAFDSDMHRVINASRFAKEVVKRLQENQGSLSECPICLDPVMNPLIFHPCGHSLCGDCLTRISFFNDSECFVSFSETQIRCPICHESINPIYVTDYDTLMRHHPTKSTDNSTAISWFKPLEAFLDSRTLENKYSSDKKDRCMVRWFADDPSFTNEVVEYNLVSELPRNSATASRHIEPGAIVRQKHCHALWKHWLSSSKIDKALEIIGQIRADEKAGKIIIFSQFTSLLDLLEIPLHQRCWAFRRYDGSMKVEDRHRAVQEYINIPDCAVLLMSLRAGNSGLNLTIASHVIILEPAWNPAVEDQAVGRVYRIGQQRPVHVHRLLVPNTVEDRIYDLQEQKRDLTSCVLQEQIGAQATKPGKDDLAFIMGFPTAQV
ncbi:DEAD/DEAH box helicase [Aspergillus stella-maris]|uniref:DEAD/DEAH box helicase n=1 Tax=Aspergillus stella-maris TaxID=1810926 RepID=UPI003CCE3182